MARQLAADTRLVAVIACTAVAYSVALSGTWARMVWTVDTSGEWPVAVTGESQQVDGKSFSAGMVDMVLRTVRK